MVCLTCWNSFEKLANHSFPALRILTLLDLDFGREMVMEDVRGNLAGDHLFFWDSNRMFQGGPGENVLTVVASGVACHVLVVLLTAFRILRACSSLLCRGTPLELVRSARMFSWKCNRWGVYSLTQEALKDKE